MKVIIISIYVLNKVDLGFLEHCLKQKHFFGMMALWLYDFTINRKHIVRANRNLSDKIVLEESFVMREGVGDRGLSPVNTNDDVVKRNW